MEAEHPLPSLGDELEEVYLLLGVGSLVLRRPGPLHQLFEGEVGILRGSSHKGGELHRLLPQFRRHRPPLRRPKCGAEGGRARVSTAGLESGRRGCKAKEGEIEFAAPIDVFWRSRAEEATKYSVQRPEREREREDPRPARRERQAIWSVRVWAYDKQEWGKGLVGPHVIYVAATSS